MVRKNLLCYGLWHMPFTQEQSSVPQQLIIESSLHMLNPGKVKENTPLSFQGQKGTKIEIIHYFSSFKSVMGSE